MKHKKSAPPGECNEELKGLGKWEGIVDSTK